MSGTPFTAPADLGHAVCAGADAGRISLVTLPPDAVPALADAFAAMLPWKAYPFTASQLRAYLAKGEPGAPRYLVTVNGAAAGAMGLRLEWLRGPYLQFLGILPAFQGRGLGAAVLGWMEREARAAGQRNLWVAASDFNLDALRFYTRAGFVAAARIDDLVLDGRTEILLRKRLG